MFKDGKLIKSLVLKYCRINKKREKSTFSAPFQVISLELFDMGVEKGAVFLPKIINLMFLS